MLLSRIAPLLIALSFFLAGQLAVHQQQLIVWAPAVFGVVLIALGQLVAKEDIRQSSFWLLMLAPILLSFAAFSFLTILVHPFWKWGVSGGVGILLLWFFQNVFQFAYQHDRYQPHAIENISTYINLIAIFFMMTALASMRLYIHINQVTIVVMGLFLFLLFVMQSLWVNKLKLSEHRLYVFTLPYIFAQVLWAALWLPTNFFIVGVLLTLSYYAVMNLVRQHLLDRLDALVVRRYVIIAVLGIVLTLSTAQWT